MRYACGCWRSATGDNPPGLRRTVELSSVVHWHCWRKWISARSRACPNRSGTASSRHRDGDWPLRDKGRKAGAEEGILEPDRRDGECRAAEDRDEVSDRTCPGAIRIPDCLKPRGRKVGQAGLPARAEVQRSLRVTWNRLRPGSRERSRNRQATGEVLATRPSHRRNRRRRERRAMRGCSSERR